MDSISKRCADVLADEALILVGNIRGNPLPDGVTRSDVCDRILKAVSDWWQAAGVEPEESDDQVASLLRATAELFEENERLRVRIARLEGLP